LATPADLVRDGCDQLPGYIGGLFAELLLAAYGSPGGAPVRLSPSATAPLPGNTAAFYALTTIWEAVFRVEERLRDKDADVRDGYDLADYSRQRRPGNSAGSFRAALDAIPRLAAGRDEDMEAWAARVLERLNKLAREHPGIDEAERWRPVPSRACPYCRCFFLKVQEDARGQPGPGVRCFGHLPSGEPCRAAWASLAEIAQDLERAETANVEG
jgi:hypothetical protein